MGKEVSTAVGAVNLSPGKMQKDVDALLRQLTANGNKKPSEKTLKAVLKTLSSLLLIGGKQQFLCPAQWQVLGPVFPLLAAVFGPKHEAVPATALQSAAQSLHMLVRC